MGTVTKWGTQMSGAALQRTRVAANYQAYVVLLGDQVLSKLMAYVQGFGYVECTPEEALQYKLNAYPAYFMLVGRLDVEPNGAFHSGAVTMEYIQMGSQAYSKLIQMRQMNPTANVVCVVGQANKKGQVSMNYMPAVLQLPPEAQQRVEAFMAKPEMLLSAFQMLDANTGRSIKQYQDWLQSKQGMPVGAVPTGGVQAPYPPMSQVVQGPVPPTSAAQGYVPGLGYPQSSGGYGSQPMSSAPAAAPQPTGLTASLSHRCRLSHRVSLRRRLLLHLHLHSLSHRVRPLLCHLRCSSSWSLLRIRSLLEVGLTLRHFRTGMHSKN